MRAFSRSCGESRTCSSAKDGIVTLTGYVETYAAKLAAERAARRVYGVKGIANDVEVRLAETRIDPDIAPGVVLVDNHLTVVP